MNGPLRLSIIAVALLVLLSIISLLKRQRIPIKYALLWLFSVIALFILAMLPSVFQIISEFIGFQTTANFMSGYFILVLLFLTVSLTIIISGQATKITLLIQEISLLKKKVENLEDKVENEK